MTAFFKRLVGSREAAAPCAPVQDVEMSSPREDMQCKILVVCKGHAFSRGVIDYAIDMAAKTRSALVALNLDENGHDFPEFRAEAERNIQHFSAKASAAGLQFSHEVRQGAGEAVIGQMYQEDSQFRYVMDDAAAICKNRKAIPVYIRATLRAK